MAVNATIGQKSENVKFFAGKELTKLIRLWLTARAILQTVQTRLLLQAMTGQKSENVKFFAVFFCIFASFKKSRIFKKVAVIY